MTDRASEFLTDAQASEFSFHEGNGRLLAAPLLNWRGLMAPQRKIAIVGKAPDTMKLAPWGDPSWQCWVLNDMPVLGEAPRFEAVFEIHDHDFAKDNQKHWQWLCQPHGAPIFMRRHYPEVPDCVPLPIEEMCAAGRPYFTNTVAYMVALAILLQPEEIGFWGVNMAAADEYAHQRPNVEYWIGVAEGRGIKVSVPLAADILKSSCLYGIESSAMAAKWQARNAELLAHKAAAENRARQADAETYFFQGALDDMKYWSQWAQTTPKA